MLNKFLLKVKCVLFVYVHNEQAAERKKEVLYIGFF